jgi:hypothetical protein
MLVKYASKFVLEVLPSVAATIIGAYIVNHYVNAKPDTPVAAAVSTADAKSADAKPDTDKPAGTASDAAGTADPAPIRKIAIDRPAPAAVEKPTETASLPVEPRRHPAPPHDKAIAKTAPTPATTVGTASIVPPVETATPQEERQQERRDANDLARAAIERLRNTNENSRVTEAPRSQEPVRVTSAPPVQPLPPPIMVSTPSAETYNPNLVGPPQRRADDPRRPTPPADIPGGSGPQDYRADATGSTDRPDRPSVADDVLSSVKSVFHSVLPR